MPKRLFLPGPLRLGEQPLPLDREHYLQHVLRLRDGSVLAVFDGAGNLGSARVIQRGRRLSLEITTLNSAVPRTAPEIHLASSVLKGKAMDQVLRKATELGASHIWPIYSTHTDVPKKALQQGALDHWQSVLISAAEQCGQDYLPRLHSVSPFAELLAENPVEQRLLTDLDGADWPAQLPYADTLIFVGPEGGWSERELDLAEAAEIPRVNLGPLVLRAETAPLVALTTLAVSWRLARANEQGLAF